MPTNQGMGYGGPPGGGMEPPEAEEPEEMEDEMEDGGKSALLPKSMFTGEVKPGDTITLTVNSVYSDEVECSVASSETPTSEPPPMSANEELDSMAGGGMA